jgi:hypothetical protein
MLCSITFLPVIREGWFGLYAERDPINWVWSFFSLFASINMEGGLAAAIKLRKDVVCEVQRWVIKEEQQRIEPELQREKYIRHFDQYIE